MKIWQVSNGGANKNRTISVTVFAEDEKQAIAAAIEQFGLLQEDLAAVEIGQSGQR